MATKTIKASGGDYTTLTAWLNSLPATLTEPEIAVVSAFDLVDVVFINKTTSAANYVEIKAATGDETTGVYGTTKARLRNGSTGVNSPIRIASGHVRVHGLQIYNENSGLGTGPIAITGSVAGSDVRVYDNLLRDAQTAGSTYSFLATAANLNLLAFNNVIYGACRTMDTRGATSALLYNNIGWRTSAQLGFVCGSEATLINNYSGASAAGAECYWLTGTPTGSYNVSSDTTATAKFPTGSVNNIAGSAVFANVTTGSEDFTHLSGSTALINAGTTVASVTTDIIGTARPQGAAYAIGAFEYASGGGGTAPAITTQPSNASVVAGATATFTAAASGSPGPTLQWQRNPGAVGTWADISGATAASYTTPATTVTGGSANNGDTYRVVATNASGSATSSAATLTVSASNAAPTFPGPSIADLTLTVGTAMTAVNVASKFSDTDTLTFSAVGTWPAGVTISSAGVISGTPTAVGNYTSLKVRATDTAAQTVDSNTFTITVAAVTATLNFQAAGMEFGARTGLGIGTFALDVGSGYRYTVHADGLTLGAAIYTSGVVTTDAAGKLPNLVDASITAGVTYRVHAVRQSDGAAATFRMTAA